MDVHGSFNLKGNLLHETGFAPESGFPPNPSPGRFAFVDKRPYICAEVLAGTPAWVPLTKEIDTYIHRQTSPGVEWTINHNLNCKEVFVQVIGSDGKLFVPDVVDMSTKNRVTISTTTPMTGVALVMRGSTEGAIRPDVALEVDFADQTVVVVNHDLGYNPKVTVIVESYEVQPVSVVHNTVNQLTVTFSAARTGTIRLV